MDMNIQKMVNAIRKDMQLGKDPVMLKEQWLMQKMMMDLEEPEKGNPEIASPADIYARLKQDNPEEAKMVEYKKNLRLLHARTDETLTIVFSPADSLIIVRTGSALQMSLNGMTHTVHMIRYRGIADIAHWMARQIRRYDAYMQQWEEYCTAAAKKLKTQHLAALAIKAYVDDALRECENVTYCVVQQSRRAKISVKFEKSNLGVNLYAFYGSYKKRLPDMLTDLKLLIDTHNKINIKTFFTKAV